MATLGRSTSCHNCRLRRVKCDEARPGCTKCRKSGRECKGYYDDSGIIFRDMTTATINKFNPNKYPGNGLTGVPASSRRARGSLPSRPLGPRDHSSIVVASPTRHGKESRVFPPSSLSSDGPDDDDDDQASSEGGNAPVRLLWGSRHGHSAKISGCPSTPIEDQASCYFSNRYALVSTQILDPGYIPILRILNRRTSLGPCLTSCLSAVAMAAFATRPSARKSAARARATYAKALQALNLAIQQPYAYNDDELLASIVVLALFEIIMSDNMNGYSSHVYGAAAMIGARGNMMFKDKLGEFLFRITCNNIVNVSLMGLASPHVGTEDWLQWLNEPRYLCYLTPDPEKDTNDDDTPSVTHSAKDKDFKSASNVAGDEAMTSVITGESGTWFVPHLTTTPIGLRSLGVSGPMPDLAQIVEHTRGLVQAYARYDIPKPSDGFEVTEDGFGDNLDQSEGSLYPVGTVHTYKDLETASFQVAGCVGRLVTCNVMARCAAYLSMRGTKDYDDAVAMGRRDLNHLIGSIPYFCGILGKRALNNVDSAASVPSSSDSAYSSNSSDDEDYSSCASPTVSSQQQPWKMTSSYIAFMMLWPMTAAATSEFIEARQFDYVLRMQRYIADQCGIKIAEGLRKFCIDQRQLAGGSFWTG